MNDKFLKGHSLVAVAMCIILPAYGCTAGGTPATEPIGTQLPPTADTSIVVVREGTELVATLSPDGRKIALIVLGQVLVVDRQGGTAIPLTDPIGDPDEYYFVSWSPDSRWVALGKRRQIRVVNVATRESHAFPWRWLLGQPVWTPDGRGLLVAIAGADSTRLVVYPAFDAGRAVRLTAISNRQGAHVAYTPDGRALVLERPLREMDLATGAISVIGDTASGATNFAYSPDGTWIAFLSERSGSRQLWVMSRAGGAARKLSNDVVDVYENPLSWTPDSRSVLYTAAGTMHLAQLDGTQERTIPFSAGFRVLRWHGLRRPDIPTPGEVRTARGIVHPQLSPDGKRVTYSALGDLWVASVDSGTPRRLTISPWTSEAEPRWSPDGSRLAYAATSTAAGRMLRLLEVDRPERQFDLSNAEVDPEYHEPGALLWSPDGGRLAYLAGGQIGWIDLTTGVARVVATAPPGYYSTALTGWIRDSITFSVARARSDTIGDPFFGVRKLVRVSAMDSGRLRDWNVPGEYDVGAGWTPDLSHSAYLVANIGYYAQASAGWKPVHISDPFPRFFSWSADGKQLLYLSGDNVRLLDVERGVARTLSIGPQFHVAASPAPLLIRRVHIIDGRGTQPTALSDLLVVASRIQRIAPAGEIEAPPGAQVVDGEGSTLLPGLFDTHVHLADGQPPDPSFLYHGVLTVRDLATPGEWVRALRERAEHEGTLSPRILQSGGAIQEDRGSGVSGEVDPADPRSIPQEVQRFAAMGADFIKIRIRNAPVDARASEAAHALGVPMTSHHLFAGTLARGLEGKEHAPLYNRGASPIYRADVLSLLKAAGTCLTPTLAIDLIWRLHGRSGVLSVDSSLLDDPALARFISPNARRSLQLIFRAAPLPAAALRGPTERFRSGLDNVRRLRDAGVRMTTGTDLNPLKGISLPLEMELLVKAGLTPLEAIRAATYDAAQCLGVEDRLGSIEVGKLADFILVEGDPSVDIRKVSTVKLVVLGGFPRTRAEILAMSTGGK